MTVFRKISIMNQSGIPCVFSGFFFLYNRKVRPVIKNAQLCIALRRGGRYRVRDPPEAEHFTSEMLSYFMVQQACFRGFLMITDIILYVKAQQTNNYRTWKSIKF